MTRAPLIWLLCFASVVAGEFVPFATTESWTCPICGQCSPGNNDRFMLENDTLTCEWYEEKFICWGKFTTFCVDHVLPIVWGTKYSIVVVKADTVYYDRAWKEVGGDMFLIPESVEIKVIKADTIWWKGKVE